MKDDLISRSALWSDIQMLPHNGDIVSSEEVEQAIKDAPAVDAEEVFKSLPYIKEVLEMAKKDLVPVVRCEVCDVPHNRWTGCPNLNGMIPPPDFYCASGVRKTEG